MCWTNTTQLTGLQRSAADIVLPDTTAHLQWSYSFHILMSHDPWTNPMLASHNIMTVQCGFNHIALTIFSQQLAQYFIQSNPVTFPNQIQTLFELSEHGLKERKHMQCFTVTFNKQDTRAYISLSVVRNKYIIRRNVSQA